MQTFTNLRADAPLQPVARTSPSLVIGPIRKSGFALDVVSKTKIKNLALAKLPLQKGPGVLRRVGCRRGGGAGTRDS